MAAKQDLRLEPGDWRLETSKSQPRALVEFGRSFLGLRSATTSTFAFEPRGLSLKVLVLPFTLTCTRRGVTHSPFTATPARRTQGYRIKPHGQLVSVSLTHYCASTPDLSTRWSSATLQVTYITGRLILRQVSRLDAFSAYLSRT